MLIMKAGIDNAVKAFGLSKSYECPLIFPTDTIFGIGAPLSSLNANKAIYKIKERPVNMAFPILAGSVEQAANYADMLNITDEAKALIKESWPGKFTFIFKAKENVNELYKQNGTIAIRVPDLEWLQKTLIKFGEPITATSINKNKQPAKNDFNDILYSFANEVDIYLKGVTYADKSSSIYDISSQGLKKLR